MNAQRADVPMSDRKIRAKIDSEDTAFHDTVGKGVMNCNTRRQRKPTTESCSAMVTRLFLGSGSFLLKEVPNAQRVTPIRINNE